MKNIYFLCLLLFLKFQVSAQVDQGFEDSSRAKTLDEVVITGQYRPQSIKKSVYQVRVISKETIQKKMPSRLQDILNHELNISFSQDMATGGSDMQMLGLSGQNVKILVDGLPMIGRQGTSNEININQVDINSIERIEIVEGPMSVVYGADALGGVINIITKKTVSRFSINARVLEESVGKEYGIRQGIHNQHVNAGWKFKNWEIAGGIGRNYFGGWKDTLSGRELAWHKKDQIVGNATVAYRNNGLAIRYRVDGLDEIITNPGNFIYYQQDANDTLAIDQEYLTRRVMQQIQASYLVNKRLTLQLQSAYTDYSRQVFSTTVSKRSHDVRLNTAPGSQSLINFTGFTLRGTAQYQLSQGVAFEPGFELNLESGDGERLKPGINKTNDISFFLTSEILVSKRISLRPGVRLIRNSVYEAPPVVPSINGKLALSDNIDLRMAFARGFRAPSLRELYFSFFDANHQILGNPDLKAETSNSFTTSIAWKKQTGNHAFLAATLNGFYNDVHNLIDYGVSANDPNVFIYMNVARHRTKGVGITTSLKNKLWNLSFGFAYTGRLNSFSDEDRSLPEFNWSGEMNSIIGYALTKCGMEINFYYKLTGKLPFYQTVVNNGQQSVELFETDAYHWADLSLSKKLFSFISVSAGVRNMFDVVRSKNNSVTGIHASSGTRSIGYGRSFFAGLNFNWEKNK